MKQILKKNRFLFILPVAQLPFVVLIFYILGGGEGIEIQKHAEKQNTTGANYDIPDAEKSIEIYDKMEAYQQEENLLAGQEQSIQADSLEQSTEMKEDTLTKELPLLAQNKDPEQLLAHIRQKEKQIKDELQGEPLPKKKATGSSGNYQHYKPKPVIKGDTKKTPQSIDQTGIKELDQIVDQNIALTRKNDSLMVSMQQVQGKLQQIEAGRNRSFSLEIKQTSGFNKESSDYNKLIKAEIYETATVLDGNRVKLRLLEDTKVNGKQINRNTFIYGTCKIKNERLQIFINQLPAKDKFIPVKLSIYDLDGMEGLYVPDNATRKVYQEVGASTNTSSLMGVTNNPLTYAGIRAADRAAQTMLKRVRLKKVTVKKNTLVYLINQNK